MPQALHAGLTGVLRQEAAALIPRYAEELLCSSAFQLSTLSLLRDWPLSHIFLVAELGWDGSSPERALSSTESISPSPGCLSIKGKRTNAQTVPQVHSLNEESKNVDATGPSLESLGLFVSHCSPVTSHKPEWSRGAGHEHAEGRSLHSSDWACFPKTSSAGSHRGPEKPSASADEDPSYEDELTVLSTRPVSTQKHAKNNRKQNSPPHRTLVLAQYPEEAGIGTATPKKKNEEQRCWETCQSCQLRQHRGEKTKPDFWLQGLHTAHSSPASLLFWPLTKFQDPLSILCWAFFVLQSQGFSSFHTGSEALHS